MQRQITATIFFIFTSILFFTSRAEVFVPATDSNIQYIGRIDIINPLSPKISWTSTQVVANFQGNFIKVKIFSRGNTYYNTNVDGKTNFLLLKNGNITYTLARNLKSGIHTVVLFKRDSPRNPQDFNGFITEDGKKLVAPPKRKTFKIEFYGDSKTQGAQVDIKGNGGDMQDSMIFDNNAHSYPAYKAKYFNAEYTCIAKNGVSLTPYTTRENLPDVYDRTGMGKDYALWDFTKWQPDVVCINLRTNDAPFPKDFTERYVNFVGELRKKYATAKIFLIAGAFSYNETQSKKNAVDNISKAVKELNDKGDAGVYYVEFKTVVNHDGHPRAKENEACAKELILKIKAVMPNKKSD
jgi:Carbohydrate esterase 2 N-terminal/GDSL-like Lipase/Acylhydrolase family